MPTGISRRAISQSLPTRSCSTSSKARRGGGPLRRIHAARSCATVSSPSHRSHSHTWSSSKVAAAASTKRQSSGMPVRVSNAYRRIRASCRNASDRRRGRTDSRMPGRLLKTSQIASPAQWLRKATRRSGPVDQETPASSGATRATARGPKCACVSFFVVTRWRYMASRSVMRLTWPPDPPPPPSIQWTNSSKCASFDRSRTCWSAGSRKSRTTVSRPRARAAS